MNRLRAEFGTLYPSQDMGKRVIIPGLSDAHIHLLHYALGLQKIDCEVPTKTECLRRIGAAVSNCHPGEWVLGHGWNQNDWQDGFGNVSDLDAIAPRNPVYLTAKSLHSGPWTNTAALRLRGNGWRAGSPGWDHPARRVQLAHRNPAGGGRQPGGSRYP